MGTQNRNQQQNNQSKISRVTTGPQVTNFKQTETDKQKPKTNFKSVKFQEDKLKNPMENNEMAINPNLLNKQLIKILRDYRMGKHYIPKIRNSKGDIIQDFSRSHQLISNSKLTDNQKSMLIGLSGHT